VVTGMHSFGIDSHSFGERLGSLLRPTGLKVVVEGSLSFISFFIIHLPRRCEF
jgi:hypothetical protein